MGCWKENVYGKNKFTELENANRRYQEYSQKVADMEHIKDLLYVDYVQAACNMQTRYAIIPAIIRGAWEQQKEKKKKDRPNFESMKHFLEEDFFNNEAIKLSEITLHGYESYGASFSCEYKGTEFEIFIPITEKINVENFKYAYKNQFYVAAPDCYSSMKILKTSYNIEDIAKTIKDYVEGN